MTDGDEFITMTGYDDALMGYVYGKCDNEPCALYDYEKVIDINMSSGMTYDEAVEYFQFNQLDAYVEPGTPKFFEKFDVDLFESRKKKLSKYTSGE